MEVKEITYHHYNVFSVVLQEEIVAFTQSDRVFLKIRQFDEFFVQKLCIIRIRFLRTQHLIKGKDAEKCDPNSVKQKHRGHGSLFSIHHKHCK